MAQDRVASGSLADRRARPDRHPRHISCVYLPHIWLTSPLKGVENVDLSDIVKRHTDYNEHFLRILQRLDIADASVVILNYYYMYLILDT